MSVAVESPGALKSVAREKFATQMREEQERRNKGIEEQIGKAMLLVQDKAVPLAERFTALWQAAAAHQEIDSTIEGRRLVFDAKIWLELIKEGVPVNTWIFVVLPAQVWVDYREMLLANFSEKWEGFDDLRGLHVENRLIFSAEMTWKIADSKIRPRLTYEIRKNKREFDRWLAAEIQLAPQESKREIVEQIWAWADADRVMLLSSDDDIDRAVEIMFKILGLNLVEEQTSEYPRATRSYATHSLLGVMFDFFWGLFWEKEERLAIVQSLNCYDLVDKVTFGQIKKVFGEEEIVKRFSLKNLAIYSHELQELGVKIGKEQLLEQSICREEAAWLLTCFETFIVPNSEAVE